MQLQLVNLCMVEYKVLSTGAAQSIKSPQSIGSLQISPNQQMHNLPDNKEIQLSVRADSGHKFKQYNRRTAGLSLFNIIKRCC